MTIKSCVLMMGLGVSVLLCGCATSQRLAGSIRGSTYTSAGGGFSVDLPVSPEVGGRVLNDNAQSVTFVDKWGSRITFSSLPILPSSTMRAMMQKDGKEKALSEFARRAYGELVEIHSHPEACDGAITFIHLRPASPKTAVAVFTHGNRLFVVETDMLPGVELLAQGDEKSQHERELWLESRAVALAQSIQAR